MGGKHTAFRGTWHQKGEKKPCKQAAKGYQEKEEFFADFQKKICPKTVENP
jgi:hypothetical protein